MFNFRYFLAFMLISFVDCSEQQPTGDLPMTTTYESIDPSSTPSGTVYTPIEKPELDYANSAAVEPVNDDYLTPNPLYSH